MHAAPTPVQRGRDDATEQLEHLVRQIMARGDAVPRRYEMPAGTFGAATVVLDLEIDGVPYWLVQLPAPVPHANAKGYVSLSPREREIVRLVAKGLPNKAIADVLDISLWTVATHLRRIFAKLGVGTRAEMVARIFEGGQPMEVALRVRDASGSH
jgi:DNA-binding CsgD family transcriptional regulator